jgi:hypothetical protein
MSSGPDSTPKTHSGKICAVHGRAVTSDGELKGSSVTGVPVGYFIVNKAEVTFGLRQLNQRSYSEEFPYGPAQDHAYWDEQYGTSYASFLDSIGVGNTNYLADNACLFNLGLRDVQNVEIHTCIHDTQAGASNSSTPPKSQWIVLDDAALDLIQETADLDGWLDAQNGYSSSAFQGFANVPSGNGGVPEINATNGYANQIGRFVWPL